MNRLERWFLKRLVSKLLARQQTRLLVRELVEQSYCYYNESNQPTLTDHMHRMLQGELNLVFLGGVHS
ncbi:hypothetical protein D3C80_1985900 [compost metagenome]